MPPPRSESLLGSESNRGVYQQERVYINGKDGSGILLPADIAEMMESYNDSELPEGLAATTKETSDAAGDHGNDTNITNDDSQHKLNEHAFSDDLSNNINSLTSPTTKYILNNHKLEERKR